jgi:type IV pilus assembly protein PilA
MNTQIKFAYENRARRKEQGFSLIELLIVVAIILIIAAIAIPNLVRARLAANEASAASSMRSIGTAQVAYAATYTVGYGTLANLGGASPCAATVATSCLLDPVLSGGTKSGYSITAKPLGAGVAFVAAAVPQSIGVTGQRTFCNDETGVIRFDITGGGAPADDVACEGFPRIQ